MPVLESYSAIIVSVTVFSGVVVIPYCVGVRSSMIMLHVTLSRLCFCYAAIAVWTQTGDVDHAWIIGSYFHYSVPGGWSAPQAKDISPAGGIFSRGDPMYVAYAHKKA